jgi:hypothetical protein
MARGVTFLNLKTRLRADLRRDVSAAVGVDDIDSLEQTINRVYETLYYDFDWPHLRRVFTRTTLSAGQRYYNMPSGCDVERIERMVTWRDGLAVDLERGIDLEHYGIYDPEDDERAEPVLRWDIRYTGSATQLEFWPMPSTSTQEFQIQGFEQHDRLVADADICRLDDNLIVLFSAAELALAQDSKDAQAKLQQAQRLYATLKGRLSGQGRTVRLGLGRPPRHPSHAVIRVS